ncbi:putative Ig domain-containing protein, partial [Nodularia chucula]|uniref:putative Ig domain-containing protein n=1 Tax=Nodularia chucula TaxID=3093667 RepID=UPI0039C72444
MVSDANQVVEFRAGFDNTLVANFVDVTAQLQADGSFSFNRTQLETIYGNTLPDGVHTLRLVAGDEFGNQSNIFAFTFTFDTTVPAPIFNLEVASDSGTVGDLKTKFDTVTLVGQTEANATVVLSQTGAVSSTDSTGKFTFTNVQLAIGDNSFTAQVTDIAGNQNTYSTTIKRLSPPTAINLAGNTVAESSTTGTVIGLLVSIDPDTTDSHTYTLVDDAFGRFRIVGNELQVAEGTLLDFETNTQHSITVKSTDASGLSLIEVFNISVTNVNEAPSFTTAPTNTSIESGSTFIYNILTADPDVGDTRIITASGMPSWLNLVDNGNGSATLQGTPTANQLGLFNLTLTVQDAGGLSATQNVLLGSQISLTEGTNFAAVRELPLLIPANPSILTFKIDKSFDTSDTDSINDALEVALVDTTNGTSLVHTVATGRDAFFNWTEGESVILGAGATYNAANGTVSLNLTGIKAGTTATLVFRLVNNDSDTTTSVSITDLTINPAPADTQPPVQGNFGSSTSSNIGETLNFNLLSDVSQSFNAEYHRTGFNADAHLLYADIMVRNIGSYSVDAPLIVAVNHISDPTIVVRNPDGFTPDGLPYYDLSQLVSDQKLDPNEQTQQRSLIFYNPQGMQFTYDLVMLAQLNQAPVIQTQANKEVIGGQFYSYDVNATDPNGDSLTYKLLASPDGMTINQTTGLIGWNTATTNTGNQIISLEVSDGRGGIVKQDYTLSVITPPPNRPPIFVTNPVVQAYINQQYSYDSTAVDPDNDTVSYSVVIGPDGLKIDPTTGQVQWTAPPALILGDTVIGQVSVAGQNQEFIFAGQAGQRIYFDPIQYTGNRGDWKFQVYSPTGRLVVDTYLAYYDNQLITLNEDGNYKIVVDPQGATTGSYGFSVINPALLPIQPFDRVVNDRLNPGPADLVYRFNATKGQKLYFDYLSRVDGSLDWAIYDPRNVAVASNGNFDDIEYDVQTSGEYILAVRGKGAFNEVNSFSFNIIDSSLPTTPYTIGSTASGTIAKKGEQDSYTFTGTAGQQLFYDTLNSTNYFPITVYDPAGRQIDSFDSRSDRGPNTPLFLGMSGTYKVTVDGSGEGTGDYKFRFLERAAATPVNLDTDINGAFADKLQTDSYSFEIPTTPLTPTPNGKQYIYIDGQAGDYYNRYNIYDAAGRNVSSNYIYDDRELYLDAGKYWLTLSGNGVANNNYKVRIITASLTTTAMNLGDTVSGTITKKGEQDSYTFTGTAGQQLFYDTLNNTNYFSITVYDPAGRQINSFGSWSDRGPDTPLFLGMSGTYKVTVDGSGEGTGDYKFRFLERAAATPVNLDTDINGAFADKLQTDSYSFEIPTTPLTPTPNGKQYIYIDGQAGDYYNRYNIYDAAGRNVSSNYIYDDRELYLDAGKYWLTLSGNGVANNNYKVRIITASLTTTAMNLGDTVSGTITKKGEQDSFTFTGTAGQQLFYDTLNSTNYFPITVYDPAGRQIDSFDSRSDRGPNTPLFLGMSGTYKVTVDGSGEGTGDYKFRFLERAAATPVNLDTPITGNFDSALNNLDAKSYSFVIPTVPVTASPNGKQYIYIDGTGGNAYNRYNIYNEAGVNVANAYVYEDRELYLDAGNYWLKLNGTGATDSSFNVRIITAPLTTTAMNLGDTVSGTITKKGEQDSFTFTGTAGQQLFYDALEATNRFQYSIYDPAGRKVLDSADSRSDRRPQDGLTLSMNGTYKVTIDGSGEGTGDYKFRFLDRNNAPVATIGGSALTGNFDEMGIGSTSYRFNVTGNQTIKIDGQGVGQYYNYWILYGADGTQITYDYVYNSQNIALDTGEYWLALQGNGAANTAYSIKLTNVSSTPSTNPTPITYTLNSVVGGAISAAAPKQIYSFNATAGQALFFDTQTVSPNLRFSILTPSGRLLRNNLNVISDYSEIFVGETGTYQLLIAGVSGGTGSYSFKLADYANGSTTSTPITFGQNVTGSLLTNGREEKFYRFTAAANQYLYIDPISGDASNSWTIYSPNGVNLSSGNLTQSKEFFLPDAGEYTLVILGKGSANNSFNLKLLTPSQDTTALAIGTSVSGNISTKGEKDNYTFSGTAGQRLYLDVLNPQPSVNGNRILITSPTGVNYLNYDLIYNDQNYLDPITLKETGTYKITVDFDAAQTGIYGFNLLNMDVQTTNALFETVTGGTLAPQESVLYKFNGLAGQRIYMDSLVNPGNVYWTLFNSSNQRIMDSAARDDREVTLAADDIYTLVFRSYESTAKTYSFKLIQPPTNATIPISVGTNTAPNVVNGNITVKGEVDTYSFSGTAGQRLYLDVLNRIGNYEQGIYIDSPTGVRYLSYDLIYNEGNYLEPITLKETGTYKVTVDYGGELTGAYGFSLMDMDNAAPLTFNTIVNGASTTGIITDTLLTGQETRFYKFTGTAGTKLYMDSLVNPGNVYWTLFNSSNQRVMDNVARNDQEIILSDDTYILAIRGYENTAKTYTFNLILPPTSAPTPISIGNNAAPNPVSGNVIVKGQNDVYTFMGTTGQRLYLDILNRTANYSNNVYIDSPTGVRYLSYEFYYNESYLEPITLKETGTYKATVDYGGEQLGTYGFSLMDLDQAAPLTFGATSLDTGIITDTLLSGQEARFYKFTGTDGEKLFFDSLQNAGAVNWMLFDSSNRRIFEVNAVSDQELTLKDDTYVLAIRGYDSTPNKAYKFKLVKPTQPITNYTVGTTINGSITRPGQNDSYKFEGKAGQRLFFDSLSGGSNFFASLYAPSGKLVSDGSSGFSNWDIRNNKINNILDENGIYTLVIDPSGDRIGDYSLRLLEYANAASTSASQAIPIALNTDIAGKYDDPQGLKSNLYKFTASAGQTIFVDVTAGTYPNGYSVFLPNGEFISGQNGIPLGQNYTSRSIVLPFTGDYTIEFYGTGNYSNTSAYDSRNDYSFQLLTPDNIISNYTLGTSVNTSISNKGEVDTYKFTGTIGQKLYFDYVVAPANERLKFYSPTGVLLNERFLNSGDFLPETLKENGTYRIEISGDNGTIGAYGFTLSDRNSVSIPAITLGTVITDTVNGNNTNLYRINGTQGQILNFDLAATSWTGANWVLYDPTGVAIASPSASTPDFKVTLPSTGLFTLAINGVNAVNLNYNFTVTNLASAPITNSGLNTLQSGTLTANTPVDYTFAATAGTQIFYDGQYDSTNGAIRGRIYNPSGVIIADNLDMRYDLAPILLKETGNYKFQTYSYYGNITGNYKYNLLEMPNSFRSPAATYLTFNGIETGTLNTGEAKVFTFQNFVGTKVLFNGMVGDGVNAYLYDPSGNVVMNFGNFRYIDSTQYVLTQEGLYHLAIAGDPGANRSYSFQMLDASSAPLVEYNLPTTGSLDNGQKDVFYKINAIAGKRLYFDNLSATSTTDINRFTWGLYAPHGSYVNSTNSYIYNDFQYDFTNSGEYTLIIRGQAVTDKLDYKFRVVQTDINNTRDIITPGVGKSNATADDGSLATVAVKLQAKDGKGGSAFQDYNIKLFADPDNANPVITSTPDTKYSLAEDGYRYTVTALDPDSDPLVYRLVNSPVGAIINRDTGELLWFPETTVISGSKANFTVEVSDRRGGKDTQTFTLDVYSQLGKIQGAVFDDLNGNGLLDSKLIKGTNPAVIIAFDVSGSTEAPFYGSRNFPNVKVVKDAEVAAIKELAKAIIAQSQGNNVKIGLITFVAGGTIEDMDLSAPGLQEYTTALLDSNNNGITNLNEVLGQQIFADNKFYPPGRSGFDAALSTIRTLLQAYSGTPNLIFMSDGYGQLDPILAANVANDIKTGFGDPTRAGNVTALAIGEASTLDTLKEIDPNAIRLKDIESLTTLFSGLDENYNLEPFKENVSVYLDLNNNAVYDPNEPIQKTKRGFAPNSLDKTSYYYTFDNLVPGDYRVRILPPAGYKITTNYNLTTGSYDPATDQGNGILHRVTTAGESFVDFFGVNQVTAPPNSDPKFVTTPLAITQLKSGELLKYNAKATDVDTDTLTFDLVLAPDGMAVDANGTVIWNPTKKQIADYYAKLDADNQFLINFGRPEAVKPTVTFDALLRVRDGQGGQDIQYIKVELLRDNTPPVFTSTTPTANPQVGKTFRYQATAIDPDSDTFTYSLLTGTPSGITINSTTGLVTWTPTTAQLGTQEFSILLTDSKGGKALQKVNLTVNPAAPNLAPVITSTPRTQTRLGNSYYYRVEATDPDGDILTYSLQTAPTGMTITDDGTIIWTPNAAQFGNHSVAIKVSDSSSTSTQSFNLNVSNTAANYPPSITSAPNLITNIDRTYEYNLTGSDPDNDLLLWSLDAAPSGMVIDEQSGTLRWQPQKDQIGEHNVKVRLTDTGGSFVGQEFTLTVTGTNIPAAIVSNPITRAAQNQLYTYTVVATDPENDQFTFSLGRKPTGMTIDDNGTIQWIPLPNQIGSQEIEVLVRDSQGAVTTQIYTIEVGATAINHAPSIISTPVYLAAVGSVYNYQVQATDSDIGDSLTYQLLSVPTGIVGMSINSTTGLLTWNNPVAGNYKIVVGAVDAAGLGAAQGFTLTARVNNPPVIGSNPVLTATPGTVYAYDIIASDANSDRLTYTLDQVSRDLGMTLDALGRLRWTPTVGNVGNHTVVITVNDGNGGSGQQQYNLLVATDTEAPKVRLIANYDLVYLGESVTFQARATDNIKVAGLQLLINNTAVVLDANGMARYTPTVAGTIIAKAVGTDTNGNIGQATFNVSVIDTSDVNAPDVSLDLGDYAGNLVTAPIDIRGSISDDGSLDYYRLLVAPVAGGDFKEIAFVDNPNAIADGVLGKFDPSLLQNDSYILRLEVADNGGHISYSEEVVDVAGELKLGNFRLSFTDLTVPVTGIPITLTRTYDTLTSSTTDDFGYGWRLEFRDTDLRTSLRTPSEEEQLLGYQSAFKDGTKVYITLPGGKREAFTFKPTIDPIFGLAAAFAGTSDALVYRPKFVADKGVTSTLTVKDARILYKAGTSEYVGLNGGINYNPADINFGSVYVLTTKEGIVYEIDGASGDLLTVTDTNGNKLTYTDGGIFSSTGQQVTFERDALGRIATVTDPMGELVRYEYNANGDLVSVTDREGNTTQMEYDQVRSHYLDKIIDPLGRTGLRNEYGDDGRLKEIIDVNGQKVEMSYDPNNSKQTVKDARGYSTTYVYDSRGNILQEIDALGGITTRTYDDNNNLLSETDADGVTTEYTYDNRRNLLTIEDEDGNIIRMTYNQRGQATNIVSPTGLTTSAKYDASGNLIESIDTDGLKTTYTYNAQGQLRLQTAPDGQVTEFDYHSSGHISRMVDSRGNEVKADYDLNGRIKKATTTFILNGQTYNQWMDYEYDDNGRTIASRTSLGNSQSMSYDVLGRVSSMTDVFGNVTSYRYDLQGTSSQNNTSTTPGSVVTRIDEMTLPDNTPLDSSDNPKVIKKYDQNNNLIAEISPTGLETRYVYDKLGRLLETIIPDLTPDNWDDNPTVKTEYSAASRIKAQIDVYGNREEYFYNDLGQLIRLKDVLTNDTTYTYNTGGQIETMTDPRNRTTRYVYDDKARLKEAIFFDNSHYQVTYDELGRVKTETNELNQTTTYEYDAYSQVSAVINALNQRTEFEYDQRRHLVKITDALGHSTRYKYDEYAQQVETLFNNGDKVSMAYDQFGRVTSVTDENLNTTKYTYDNLSQLTQVEQANQAKTKYTYNNLGLLTQIEDANQNITQYEYDDFYRSTATILPLGQRNQTVYDQFGQVSSQKDFNGDIINYSYDSIGRLQQKAFTDPRVATVSYTYDAITSQLQTVTDGRGVTQYNYDQRDRLSKIIQPNQQFVSYGYDLLDNVTSLTTQAGTTSYGYDSLNRLDTVKDGTRLLADYDYDAVGNLIQTKLANSSVESRQYDTRNRLTQVTTKNVTGTIFSDFKYTLDAVGNRKRVEEYGGRSVDYTYDSLYRLTEEKINDATAGNRTFGYSYDLAGNRLSKTDSTEGLTTYGYDANNRILNTTIGSIVTNFTYDNNGSLKQRSDGTQTITYDWINDGENRLIGVTSSSTTGTSQQQYIYDAFGSRVASIDDGVRTNYLAAPIWDLPQVLMEYDSTGEITTDYTHGIGLVRSRHDDREGFYHTDGLGSTRLITDNV